MSNFTNDSALKATRLFETNAKNISILAGLLLLLVLALGLVIAVKCLCKRREVEIQNKTFSLKLLKNNEDLELNKEIGIDEKKLSEDIQALTKNDILAQSEVEIAELAVDENDPIQHRDGNVAGFDNAQQSKLVFIFGKFPR